MGLVLIIYNNFRVSTIFKFGKTQIITPTKWYFQIIPRRYILIIGNSDNKCILVTFIAIKSKKIQVFLCPNAYDAPSMEFITTYTSHIYVPDVYRPSNKTTK